MRIILATLLLASGLAAITPEAAACHPYVPLTLGPATIIIDPHGCGPKPDPMVCVWINSGPGCML